ncbi:hypothetical protein B1M_25542 [Burkholderia sp. TJI49]|nr:hypothetical protein B1M_25542 [Burkholderia sp. TJI49]
MPVDAAPGVEGRAGLVAAGREDGNRAVCGDRRAKGAFAPVAAGQKL